nr:AlpA family phage regulatory protein [Comamonas testosteroni]
MNFNKNCGYQPTHCLFIAMQKPTHNKTTMYQPHFQTANTEKMHTSKVDPVLAQFDRLPDSAHIRLHTVTKLFGVSKPTIYRWVREQKFPAPKHFSNRVSSWNVGELRAALGVSSSIQR